MVLRKSYKNSAAIALGDESPVEISQNAKLFLPDTRMKNHSDQKSDSLLFSDKN